MKIIDACRDNNLPEPTMKNEQGGFVTILYKAEQKPDTIINKSELNARQIKAIEYVKEHGKITNSEYQKLNNISRITATRDLIKLVKLEVFKSSEIKGAGSFFKLHH
ncbi:MAG: hypothetical protein L6407_04555 [Candidatus Delongbacteria bacterium]|nr:hypothetical protein [Candidatus Delongbacteria bacterium]